MGRSRLLVTFAGAALILGACDYVRDRPLPVAQVPHVRDAVPPSGEELYLRDCAWCHGANGEGTARGPDLDGELDGGAYTYLMLSTGRMPISSPDEEARRRPPRYTEAEIAALVEHVSAFGGTGPDIPSPDPAQGNLAAGGALYAEHCAACHSTTGVGGALTSGQTAPSVLEASPAEVAAAMLVGPGCANDDPTCGPGSGAMPVFDAFSDEEVDSIVAYVRHLQVGGDPGGLGLGRIGQVAEGALSLIGLALLILFIRWVGTRVGEHG